MNNRSISMTDPRLLNYDNVYLNIINRNRTNLPILARYEETRSKAIITNPSEYFLGVVSFDLPIGTIPIFKVKYLNDTDLIYSFTVKNGVLEYQQYFQNTLDVGDDIFIIQDFLDIANNAIAAACAVVGLPDVPVIYFEPTTQLMTIQFSDNANWLGDFNTATWQLWANFPAFDKFAQLQAEAPYGYNGPNGKSFRYVVKNNFSGNYTPGVGYSMVQEFPYVSQWSDLGSIVFATNRLPVNKEDISFRADTGNSAQFSILYDYLPNRYGDVQTERINVTYKQDQPRLINLVSSDPLRSFDIQVFYVDLEGKIYPLYIQPENRFVIKLGFFKKSMFSNAWTN